MLQVTRSISISESELHVDFVRSPGPGGQNVNKVSTAVQLRFDIAGSPSLPEPVRLRLIRLGGRRVTKEGVLIIIARRFRSQEKNRDDAIRRLAALIVKAATEPKKRKKTKPTLASKQSRIDNKHHRGRTKRSRRPVRETNDD